MLLPICLIDNDLFRVSTQGLQTGNEVDPHDGTESKQELLPKLSDRSAIIISTVPPVFMFEIFG